MDPTSPSVHQSEIVKEDPLAELQGERQSATSKVIRISLVLAIFVLLSVAFAYLNTLLAPKLETAKRATQLSGPPVLPTQEAFPSGVLEPTDLSFDLPGEEIKATVDVQQKNYLYAVKIGKHVTVYQRNVQDGAEKMFFEYDESVGAKNSGNLWEEQLPSVALSPNKQLLAYIDSQGLKLIDLRSGESQTLISETTDVENSLVPPTWTIQEIKGVFVIAQPRWSGDSRYVSFGQGYYEGSDNGIINIRSGEYVLSEQSGDIEFIWSPVGALFAEPGTAGGYSTPGLFVSLPGDVSKATNIAATFGKDDASFGDVQFSPDGEKIVFRSFRLDKSDQEIDHFLGVANRDGTGFREFLPGADNRFPFFSQDGNSLFYIEGKDGKATLWSYRLDREVSSRVVDLPTGFQYWTDPRWTKDGHLTLTGVRRYWEATIFEGNTRLFFFDTGNKQMIYASPLKSAFTNFLGFVE